MIEFNNLQKVIDQNTAIDIEALKVEAGEIAALVGPINSGKETLLELLTGLSGSIGFGMQHIGST